MEINYTIIIPHKNTPQLLQRCLDSIPPRDDIQIIIVDDNSDPSIVHFDHFPGLDQPNTEVYFTKVSKGAGYARNVGLQHAKGKWLVFADADDFFMPCFNEALDKYMDNENDVIYFKQTAVDSKTLKLHTWYMFVNDILSKIQKTNDWNLVLKIVPTPWGKLIKHDLIMQHNIQFQESLWSNDVLFFVKLATISTKKLISDQIVYCYVINRQESLMGNHTIESMSVRHQVCIDAFVYLKKISKEKYYFHFIVFWWFRILKTGKITVAISLLHKMFKICGFWYTLKGIIRNIRLMHTILFSDIL